MSSNDITETTVETGVYIYTCMDAARRLSSLETVSGSEMASEEAMPTEPEQPQLEAEPHPEAESQQEEAAPGPEVTPETEAVAEPEATPPEPEVSEVAVDAAAVPVEPVAADEPAAAEAAEVVAAADTEVAEKTEEAESLAQADGAEEAAEAAGTAEQEPAAESAAEEPAAPEVPAEAEAEVATDAEVEVAEPDPTEVAAEEPATEPAAEETAAEEPAAPEAPAVAEAEVAAEAEAEVAADAEVEVAEPDPTEAAAEEPAAELAAEETAAEEPAATEASAEADAVVAASEPEPTEAAAEEEPTAEPAAEEMAAEETAAEETAAEEPAVEAAMSQEAMAAPEPEAAPKPKPAPSLPPPPPPQPPPAELPPVRRRESLHNKQEHSPNRYHSIQTPPAVSDLRLLAQRQEELTSQLEEAQRHLARELQIEDAYGGTEANLSKIRAAEKLVRQLRAARKQLASVATRGIELENELRELKKSARSGSAIPTLPTIMSSGNLQARSVQPMEDDKELSSTARLRASKSEGMLQSSSYGKSVGSHKRVGAPSRAMSTEELVAASSRLPAFFQEDVGRGDVIPIPFKYGSTRATSQPSVKQAQRRVTLAVDSPKTDASPKQAEASVAGAPEVKDAASERTVPIETVSRANITTPDDPSLKPHSKVLRHYIRHGGSSKGLASGKVPRPAGSQSKLDILVSGAPRRGNIETMETAKLALKEAKQKLAAIRVMEEEEKEKAEERKQLTANRKTALHFVGAMLPPMYLMPFHPVMKRYELPAQAAKSLVNKKNAAANDHLKNIELSKRPTMVGLDQMLSSFNK